MSDRVQSRDALFLSVSVCQTTDRHRQRVSNDLTRVTSSSLLRLLQYVMNLKQTVSMDTTESVRQQQYCIQPVKSNHKHKHSYSAYDTIHIKQDTINSHVQVVHVVQPKSLMRRYHHP